MRVANGNERLFDDDSCFSEAGIEVAEAPIGGEFSPFGFFARSKRIDCRLWPFDVANFGAAYRRTFRAFFLRSHQRIALWVGTSAPRREALEGVNHERAAFEIDAYFLDGRFSDLLGDGRNCKNRLADKADIFRCQSRVGGWRYRWEVVGGEYAENAIHPQCFSGVDANDSA